MMKTLWWTLIFIFGSALPAWSQTVSIASENICTECSILVKSMMDGRRIVGESPNPNQVRVALAMFHHPQLRYLESLAINQIGGRVAATPFGRSLIASSKQAGIRYRLFYQVGVDDRGMTSLNNNQAVPTYQLDRKDPHELWGFFQNVQNHGLIFINEYQKPWNAPYTMIHEMFHLLDEKTGQYIQSRENQAWTGLDDLVLEFRAQLAEIVFRQQQIEAQAKSPWRELTGQKDLHDRFLSRSQIQVEKLALMVVDLMYPLQAPAGKELAFDSDAPIFEVMNRQKSAWNVPVEILRAGILDAISWFMGQSMQRCSDEDCSALHVALLNYQMSLPQEAVKWAQERRLDLQQELQNRGARSFYEYLKTQGLFDDLSSGLKLRQTGLNLYGSKSGGPSPRLGGGSRPSRSQNEKFQTKEDQESFKFRKSEPSSQSSSLRDLERDDSSMRFEKQEFGLDRIRDKEPTEKKDSDERF